MTSAFTAPAASALLAFLAIVMLVGFASDPINTLAPAYALVAAAAIGVVSNRTRAERR